MPKRVSSRCKGGCWCWCYLYRVVLVLLIVPWNWCQWVARAVKWRRWGSCSWVMVLMVMVGVVIAVVAQT